MGPVPNLNPKLQTPETLLPRSQAKPYTLNPKPRKASEISEPWFVWSAPQGFQWGSRVQGVGGLGFRGVGLRVLGG